MKVHLLTPTFTSFTFHSHHSAPLLP